MKKLVLALVALAAIVAVATPALADYNFYGSARVKTYYQYDDKANANNDVGKLELQSNSRFGANVTTGDLGGRFEIGLGPTIGTRLIYGTWKTDMGTLLVGQTYMPYWTGYAMVYADDNGLTGYGQLYEGRTPQIKFDFTSGLYVAMAQNKNAGKGDFLPKLVAGFKNKAGNLSYNLGVAYQAYDTNAVLNRHVQSYLTWLEMTMKQDAMTVTGKLHYGTNLKEFGFANRTFAYVPATNDSTESFGGIAQVSVSGANVGVAYVVDSVVRGAASKNVAAFINYNIKPVKGMIITPEIMYFDNDVNAFDFDGADKIAATIQWRMDF